MIKNDRWIIEQARNGMIQPFEPSLIRAVSVDGNGLKRPGVSYGLSSYGYDIRL